MVLLLKFKSEKLVVPGADENMILVGVRIFPSMDRKIERVLKFDREDVFESKSHFVRSAVNYFLKNSPTVKVIIEGKKW